MTPTILYFDTSAAHWAAALLLDGSVTVRIDDMARGQAEHLMIMLEEVLATGGVAWSDLSAVAVGTGPGNFTGIRISVAAARGLALGTGVPAIGVSGFETTARLAKATGVCRICLTAPRDTAYVQPFDEGRPSGPARHLSAAETGALCVGPAASLIGGNDNFAAPATDHVHMAVLLAAEKLAAGVSERPAPLYVRAADAAPSRDAAPVILP